MEYPWANPVYAGWRTDKDGKQKYLGSRHMPEFKKMVDEQFPGFWINPVIKFCVDQSEICLIEQDKVHYLGYSMEEEKKMDMDKAKKVMEEVQNLIKSGWGYDDDPEGALFMVLERMETAGEITAEESKELDKYVKERWELGV